MSFEQKRFISTYIRLDYRSSDDKKNSFAFKIRFQPSHDEISKQQKIFSNKNTRQAAHCKEIFHNFVL